MPVSVPKYYWLGERGGGEDIIEYNSKIAR